MRFDQAKIHRVRIWYAEKHQVNIHQVGIGEGESSPGGNSLVRIDQGRIN